MPSPLALQAMQTGGQVAGGLVGNLWNIFHEKRNRAEQYKMTDYLYDKDLEQWNRQNEYNLEMWNLQNQYNSPLSQMQRFKAAGLNPNLIYGQGTPGLAGNIPMSTNVQAHGDLPTTAKIDMPPLDFIKTFMDAKLQNETIKNMQQARINAQEQGKILEQEAIIRAAEAGFKPEEIDQMRKKYAYENELWQYDLDAAKLKDQQIESEIIKNVGQRNLTDRQIEMLQSQLDWMNKTGISRDKAPWWLQFIIGLGQDFEGSMVK